MPDDRDRLLDLLDRYLSLPDAERAEYALGVRLGVFRRLEDLTDETLRARLAGQLSGLVGGASVAAADDREPLVRAMLEAARDLRARFI